jgi:hypothetical protein
MTYNQIKSLIVPGSKRTAKTVQKWVAKMPAVPIVAVIALQLGVAVLTLNLTQILIMGLFCPPGLLTYAVLMAAIMVMLAALQVYNDREKIAKAMVVLLEAL